ncbi:zinc finger protein 280C [Osmerus mordax]|uniref:zinc finger protein 280C n=1 Tax=Osmerus mordax TaxID=8014 RepID=UPI00350FF2F2
MSELFMECEEEELEPWQIQVPKINLVDDNNDDDDEPIFIGELSSSKSTSNLRQTNHQKNIKTIPVQTGTVGRLEANTITLTQTSNVQSLTPQYQLGPGQSTPQSIILPGNGTVSSVAQPIFINNQGYIVSSPQNNSTFITSLGKQYPPGTSFTIVSANQQHFMHQLTPSNPTPGVIHRPQVQQISNNVVTLSNVQSPVAFSQTAQSSRQLSQPVQIVSGLIKAQSSNKDNLFKRISTPDQTESTVKRPKIDITGSTNAVEPNVVFRKPCPKCRHVFFSQDILNSHMKSCCPHLVHLFQFPCQVSSKRIMLVKDFYYGIHEGDKNKQQGIKTNTTFKCQSCLKVLKNNVRFMNHMKHHLELEKQNSESWESHTTCQHCYRQYTTPFQLQCHIESAHSPFESSTNCKICELAFESEQVLLEHMKDNHKPGEMPYMCQVCNYRSSFFCEVETHFRSVHENTKDLLCPFCLKVLRSGHMYMQHYMKHQRKGIHRCGKCRLNFLTYKERVDHKLHFHKTFKKPAALEGLPPGTKVTVRASLTGPTPTSPGTPNKSMINVVPDIQATKHAKSQATKTKSVKQKEKSTKKQERQPKKRNKVLKNLRIGSEKHTCIECETVIDNFFSHYPSIVTCGACKYQTSCKISVGNHMIRFHSNVSAEKIKRMDRRKIPPVLKSLTLICLNCDLLVDAAESDRMSKHLANRPQHVCKVIEEKNAHESYSFSYIDHMKGKYPSRIQKMQQTNRMDALRLPPLVEPSVHCVPSDAGGAVVQEMSLRSEEDIILIDDDTAAQNTSELGLPAVSHTQDVPEAAPMEGSVGGEPREEPSLQLELISPSPPVTCELDEGAVPLIESSGNQNSLSLDVDEQVLSEQVLSPLQPEGAVQAEVSSLVTESPAGDLLFIPDSRDIPLSPHEPTQQL